MLHWIGRILQYLYLLRVPILGFVLLLVLASLGGDGPPTITNMMLMADAFRLGTTVFLAGVFAGVTGLLMLITWRLIPERFSTDSIPIPGFLQGLSALRCLPFLLLALPLVMRLWHRNAFDPLDSPRLGPGNATLATLAGLVLVVALFFLVELLRRTLIAWMERHQGHILRALADKLGPGYVDPATGRFQPGHILAAAMAVVLASIYLIGYHVLDPADATEVWVSTLAYVLGLVLLLVALLTGVAFFFDRFRVPLLLALALYATLMGWLFPTEHTFQVRPLAATPPQPAEALQARWRWQSRGSDEQRPGPRPVLTVVAASGGGIQASAWTAQVLTGLQEELGERFTHSIQLISSVSGGSLGTYFFLHGFDPEGAAPRAETLEPIRRAAMGSSLEATAWGLVYPDFLRAFLPVIGERYDRAWATEQAWLRATRVLRGETDRIESWMSSWNDRARDGRVPGVILNATVVEDGGQLLLSNLDLHELDAADPDRHGYTVHQRYGEPTDLPTVSAARLSATFPYVTPVARAARPDGSLEGLESWHIADGGYFDNFGMVSAIRWLTLLPPEALEPFETVLFLQIDAFPEGCPVPPPDTEEATSPEVRRKSWFDALVAPIATLARVRTSTQASRSQLELGLLERLEDRIQPMVIQAPTRQCDDEKGPHTDTGPQIPGCEKVEHRQPPLSWYLAESDKKAVECDWKRLLATGKIEEIRPLFEGGPPPEQPPEPESIDAPDPDNPYGPGSEPG